MEAVAAFSHREYTPPVTTTRPITEYTDDEDDEEEGSLFDNGGEQPFERFFDVSTRDAHMDKTQQISLLPPDDDENEDDDFDYADWAQNGEF
jgi:hypothetical protein